MREENYSIPAARGALGGAFPRSVQDLRVTHPTGASSHVHLCTLLPALRAKSPPTPVLPAATCSNSFLFSPSPQSAAYPVRYTLVYISTAVFYSESLVGCSLPARFKLENFYCSRKQTLIKKFATRADFFHKVRPDCGKKIIVYPRLEALLRVPFREVYRILRSTPFGRLRSCTS